MVMSTCTFFPSGNGRIRTSPRVCDGTPDFFRRQRHVDVTDTVRLQRVEDSRNERRGRTARAGFAGSLDPELVRLAGYLVEEGIDRRQMFGPWHAVIHVG